MMKWTGDTNARWRRTVARRAQHRIAVITWWGILFLAAAIVLALWSLVVFN